MNNGAEPVRVIHLVSALQPGGLEHILIDLVTGLHRRGWPQVVCLQHGRGAWCERVPSAVPVSHLSCSGNVVSTVQRLCGLVRQFDAQIIHSLSFGVWGEAAGVRAMSRRLCHLHAFHGFFGPVPPRWEWYGRLFGRATDGCYAVAPSTADEASRRFRIPRQHIELISNGVDVERFSPAIHPDSTNAVRDCCRANGLLTCIASGSVKDVKRPDRFVEVAERLKGDIRFVWMGDGPLLEDMRSRVRERGLQDRVEFVGAEREVVGRLRAADLFLLTSDQEAAPLAVLEAMAVGLPVVATPVGEVGRWISESGAGVVTPSHSDIDLAAAVSQLGFDSQMRRRMGHSAREYVKRHYSSEKMIDDYERFFLKPFGRTAPITSHPSTRSCQVGPRVGVQM